MVQIGTRALGHCSDPATGLPSVSLFSLLLVFASSSFPQAIPAARPASKTDFEPVSVCEIMKDPVKWNGKMVEIRGISNYGLRDAKRCEQIFVTEGHRWPDAIDLVDAEENQPAYPGTVTFADWVGREWQLKKEGPREGFVVATFYGMVRARTEYVTVYTNYGVLGNGFGHLGAYPAQLIVYGVADVRTSKNPPELPKTQLPKGHSGLECIQALEIPRFNAVAWQARVSGTVEVVLQRTKGILSRDYVTVTHEALRISVEEAVRNVAIRHDCSQPIALRFEFSIAGEPRERPIEQVLYEAPFTFRITITPPIPFTNP